MNKVIMMGRLTADPELRQAGETAVTRFRIAVPRRFKRDGAPEADFFNCTAFGKAAENISRYFAKGSRILIEGRLENNNWTSQDGQEHRDTQIMVEAWDFIDSKAKSDPAASQTPQRASQAAHGVPDANGFMAIPDGFDEELPFR